ncbi:FAD-binding protein [Penicillium odoratum]|uniref:FAD-binding protein n=1 Tax=Penicillium odoratum TaxID=1167516 RepID=UPI002547F463|nr:FAD-binding protein [Penicillium odoratum]KAJ5765279.1 FAD-binding protein [Penicillium odoratum]
MPERFYSFTEVQGSINSIQYDVVKLARMKGEYRAQLHPLDLCAEDMPHIIAKEQQRLKNQVDSLQRRFADFRARLDVDPKFENISCILQLRWTMLKIWVICLGEKNTVYDSCIEDFAKIINYARKSQLLSTAPGFMLEVGLLPYLFFVIAKCRNLQLRLRALSLIQKECYNDHDIFWDPSIIYGMSKRIFRAEYGLKINDTHATVLEAVRDSPFFAENTRLCHEFEAWEIDTRIDLPEVRGLGHGTVTGSIPIAEALGVPNWKRDQPPVVV